ncbi:hypothetical protein [Flavobacterium sp.]|uniref:hypothetical protein n=1 Tax=Flavobacterium sp. TaxID=239 RepID=UPI002622A427|nr:hypothetical protein [Flavobacterium sp.]MDD3005722.1 hypothetical protein [Flavobacterium sp.]
MEFMKMRRNSKVINSKTLSVKTICMLPSCIKQKKRKDKENKNDKIKFVLALIKAKNENPIIKLMKKLIE